MVERFDYSLFGLVIRSGIELPELPTAVLGQDPDAEVTVGPVSLNGEEREGYRIDGSSAGFAIDGVGKFQIADGNRIVVEPDPQTPARNVRLYLLGSAIGVLLHQRGMLPIHANSIEIGGRAYAFIMNGSTPR